MDTLVYGWLEDPIPASIDERFKPDQETAYKEKSPVLRKVS